MGEKSAISWTDHTFNPWWGCVKISPACTNCYAATFDYRLGGEHWGPKSERKFFGDKHWDGPRKWNASAQKRGVRERVFCASMADVFEDREDLVEPRKHLFSLIAQTPNLDWLLLTKRPENLAKMLPWCGGHPYVHPDAQRIVSELGPWKNVWLGTSVENQDYADERIPRLLAVPAVVHFLSCEPLLGEVDLDMPRCDDPRHGPECWTFTEDAMAWCVECESERSYGHWLHLDGGVDWVISGCESGHGARSCDVEWLRTLRDQCAAAGVPFFLKQAGDHRVPLSQRNGIMTAGDGSKCKAGGVIELPYLDGEQWAQFPEVAP